MGAFFLFKKATSVDRGAVRQVFRDRGFTTPIEDDLGEVELWTYPKLIGPRLSGCARSGGLRLWTVGSPVYKGLPYQDGLDRLAHDIEEGGADYSDLLGGFCLIVCRGGRFDLRLDPSGLYQIFRDSKGGVISSSMLAILHSRSGRWEVDPGAVLENLCLGFNLAPTTWFNGILRLDGLSTENSEFPAAKLVKIPASKQVKVDYGSRQQCLEAQLHGLRRYFRCIQPVVRDCGVHIGLSGGYDSRLLLGLARELGVKPSAHSHFKNPPDGDLAVARRLARVESLELASPEHPPPEEMGSREFESILKSAFLFFDGRANLMMEYLKPEYTPEYRRQVFGESGLILSGVGGEIYRNHYGYLPVSSAPMKMWLRQFVIGNHVIMAMRSNEAVSAVVKRLAGCVAERLSCSEDSDVNLRLSRRIYGNLWMPTWHGLRNSVENQASLFLSPFAERSTVERADAATKFLGPDGAFEAAMIRISAPDLASLPSGSGHSFDRIPLSAALAGWGRAVLPLALRSSLARFMVSTGRGKRGYSSTGLLVRHPILQESLHFLESLRLPIDWERYMSVRTYAVLALSMGFSLMSLADKVSVASCMHQNWRRWG